MSYSKFLIFLVLQVSLVYGAKDTLQFQKKNWDFIVASDGSGDFKTIQEAFDATGPNQEKRTTIFVKNGVYKEVLVLPKNRQNICLIGESIDNVILTFDNYASRRNPETNEEYGTSGSSSTYIYGDGFYAHNITFKNSAGPVGQTLAIYIDGDKEIFTNCRFIGFQDTIYTGKGREYFKNCYIEGSTDFIFGPATAYFDHCEIHAKRGSAITAASTESYVEYGYVFNNCVITGTGSGITTLGRPWRPYASVTFLNTTMDASIEGRGWDNWRNPENEDTARYSEYKSSGKGANMGDRVKWVEILSDEEAENFTIENVFRTTYNKPPKLDNWNPTAALKLYMK